jgi:hypothetical protein
MLSVRTPPIRKTETNIPTIYRQHPSLEVNAAWDRASSTAAVLISSADVLALGREPSIAVQTPSSFGHGPDANLAQIDAFRQIYCLNMIPKTAYQGCYLPPTSSDPVHWTHVSHCIGSLLQKLIVANESINIITHN